MEQNWKNNFPQENIYFETNNGLLYKGEAIAIMSKFPEKIIDTIITDPPYGTTACKWDSIIPFDDMWKVLKKIRKDKTPIVLFGSEPFSSFLRISNIKEYKYDWIWNKKLAGNPLIAKYQPLKIFELISVFCKKSPNYYPIMTKGKKRKKGGCKTQPETLHSYNYKYNTINDLYYPKAIIEFPKTNRKNALHPTQKPLELMEYLIKTYTKEGDIILDFTAGSGTTLLAAEKLNRKWIGIELEEKYCNVIKDRILKFLNKEKNSCWF